MPSIKEYRVNANMTQVELAQKLKVSKSTVAMWETGRRTPRLSALKKLSAVLRVTVDELVKSSTADDTKSG